MTGCSDDEARGGGGGETAESLAAQYKTILRKGKREQKGRRGEESKAKESKAKRRKGKE